MELIPLHTGPLGVNTWIVPISGPYVFVVDPAGCNLTGDSNVITEYLQSNKLLPVLIVLTHGHFDHISGLPAMRTIYPSIPIAIHSGDADCIGFKSAIKQEHNLSIMHMRQFLPAVTDLPDPDFLLSDGDSLDIIQSGNGLELSVRQKLSSWHILYTPGHSPGSVCLYNSDEKLLISGDTVFYRSYGRTDLDGGSESLLFDSLMRLRKILPGDTRIYPGHMEFGFEFRENY